jgi:hypothetical protein
VRTRTHGAGPSSALNQGFLLLLLLLQHPLKAAGPGACMLLLACKRNVSVSAASSPPVGALSGAWAARSAAQSARGTLAAALLQQARPWSTACQKTCAHRRLVGAAQVRQISSTRGVLFPSSEPKAEAAPARKLARYSYPSLESIVAEPPPRRFSEFDNETIALLAGEGVYGAFKERLLREIMRVDRCSYVEAYRVLGEMNECNEQGMWLRKLPYTLGIGGTAAVGTLAIPAVFNRGTRPKFVCATAPQWLRLCSIRDMQLT